MTGVLYVFQHFPLGQVENTVKVDNGKHMSFLWSMANLDIQVLSLMMLMFSATSNSKNVYLVAFATSMGVNHCKQSVLFGCALIADESQYSIT